MNAVVNFRNHKFMNARILYFIAYEKLSISHCRLQSERRRRKTPVTGYLPSIGISVPVVDLGSVHVAECRLFRR